MYSDRIKVPYDGWLPLSDVRCAWAEKAITDWEWTFYRDIIDKRSLSKNQHVRKRQIEYKINRFLDKKHQERLEKKKNGV